MKNQLPATLIASLAAAGLSAPGVVEAAAPARPNIVLIVSDDHGLDALGCHGNPVIRTPHLDALAAAGTRFTRAFCTSASCSPSRSVILTGLHGHHNGMFGLQHDEHHFQCFDHVRSLPVMLEAAGYRTARIGKYHVAPGSVFRFQTVLSGGAAGDPKPIGRSPVEMAWRARELIESADARPFFLYFATDDPHRAGAVLPDGTPTFDTWPEPNHFGNRPAGHPGITPVVYNPADVLVPPFLPDTPACRAELAQYYQSVSRLDQGVGVLIKQLKDAGKYDNTLIIYISDNGAAFPGAKTTLYEPGIRLPCIIKSPRQPKGGVTQDALVSWVDLTPTILDVAGALPPGAGFDGRSFKAGLDGTPLRGRDAVYASHTFHQVTMYYPMRAVRTEKYKLIHNLAHPLAFPSARDLIQSPTWVGAIRDGGGLFGKRSITAFLHRPEFELYDLEADPDEINNLADAPALREVRDSLINKTRAFQSETRDPWLHKWQYE